MASRWVWCIFQFPAITGVRARLGAIPLLPGPGRGGPQRLETREVTLLEVFERGPAARGDVVDAAVEAELFEGGRAVATPDDREAPGFRHRLRDTLRARRERCHLEHAHRSVPKHEGR